MKKLLTVLLNCVVFITFAQNEKSNWFFGRPYGVPNSTYQFDGSSGLLTPVLPGPTVSPDFGFEATFIANNLETGDLMFFTDGKFVYDENHVQQDSNLKGNPSSAQPVAVCPVPICPMRDDYFIFSNPTGKQNGTWSRGPLSVAVYSTDGTISTPVDIGNKIGEGLMIVPSLVDPMVFWLFTRDSDPTSVEGQNHSTFNVYRIDALTIDSLSTLTPHFTFHLEDVNVDRYSIMQFTYNTRSTQGEPFVIIGASDRIGDAAYIFEFNTETGTVNVDSNNVVDANDFKTVQCNEVYDLEFSPNGEFLYTMATHSPKLIQHNLSAGTQTTIATWLSHWGGGLETSPDGSRIYMVHEQSTAPNKSFLSDIVTPNVDASSPAFVFNNHSQMLNVKVYNLPEFIEVPQWKTEIQISGSDILCSDLNTVILNSILDPMGQTVNSYRWYKNGVLLTGETFPTLEVSEPGIYKLEVYFTNGCRVIDEVEIREAESICECAQASSSTIIENNLTITQNTIWDDKVYIADNVTVTVDGATLDITNVDVIFGSCAEIDFINDAKLRANNSVFRPCDVNEVWNGLDFDASTDNRINECTFKNARVALEFTNQSEAEVHGTLFKNCLNGIIASCGVYNAAITHNEFVVDNDYPSAASCNVSTGTTFLYSSGTDFEGEVAGNSVQNTSDIAFINYGIYMQRTNSAFINNNEIVNAATGIYCTFEDSPNDEAHIANNRILAIDRNLIYGIRMGNMVNGVISGNEISSNNGIIDNGIYTYNCDQSEYRTNFISQTSNGITINRGTNSLVVDNSIKRASLRGIQLPYISHVKVACNEIDIDDFTGSIHQGIGIRYYGNSSSTNNEISSNCVLNSVNAMYVGGLNSSDELPKIRNNFFYNYGHYGIYNHNLSGNIGSATEPGMNTFYSNSNAYDIYSASGTINTYDNFSLSQYNAPNVSIFSNSEIYSTAACAKTLYGVNNQTNWIEELLCYDDSFLTPTSTSSTLANNNEEFPEVVYTTGVGQTVIMDVATLNVYPNPVQNEINISFVTDEEKVNGQLLIFTMDGKHIKEFPINIVAGNVRVNIGDLAKGMYIINLMSDNEIQTTRFIKE
ncbi:T9SS type A sorting domain-containing protein [Aquimarina rhabdastrellae]